MKKKLISLLLALVMICSMVSPALAASDEAISAANALHELGLFSGTGTDANGKPNFDLDRTPTRQEAIVMLVRLLGKEQEAKAGTWEMPFTDVDAWAKPYVGYAFAKKLATGTGATTFGANDPVNATQYLTFILRALNYDTKTDFKWEAAWELSDEIGLTNGQHNATSAFTRGDIASISLAALNISPKHADYDDLLLDSLLNNNTITQEKIISSGINVRPKPIISDNFRYLRYIKANGKTYILSDSASYGGHTLDRDFSISYDKYTNIPYMDVENFATLVCLLSGDYEKYIEGPVRDESMSEFINGFVLLSNKNIDYSRTVEYNEISLDNFQSNVSISYNGNHLKYALSSNLPQVNERLATEKRLSDTFGMTCIIKYDRSIPLLYFSVFDLLEYFHISDTEMKTKIQNMKIETIDNNTFLILD